MLNYDKILSDALKKNFKCLDLCLHWNTDSSSITTCKKSFQRQIQTFWIWELIDGGRMNIVQILSIHGLYIVELLFQYFQDIIQMSHKYCSNIIQIWCGYCWRDILQILTKYCPDFVHITFYAFYWYCPTPG